VRQARLCVPAAVTPAKRRTQPTTCCSCRWLDGSPAPGGSSYIHWGISLPDGAKEPNNASPKKNEFCAAANYSQQYDSPPAWGWADQACEHQMPFMCKKQPLGSSFLYISPSSRITYIFNATQLPFVEAQASCNEQGGHLVYYSNLDEQKEVGAAPGSWHAPGGRPGCGSCIVPVARGAAARPPSAPLLHPAGGGLLRQQRHVHPGLPQDVLDRLQDPGVAQLCVDQQRLQGRQRGLQLQPLGHLLREALGAAGRCLPSEQGGSLGAPWRSCRPFMIHPQAAA
jgi:hypothetical protein